MPRSVGLEVMNSTNPELNWKTVTKGRRSRKAIARSLNGVAKVGNSTSPKRVGDFSGSDSDKFGEVVRGQSTSGKSENVRIKKMRHLLQSPSPHPWTLSLRRHDSASPQTCSSSPFSEDHEQLLYPSCSSGQRSSNWQLRGIDGSAGVRFGEGFDNLFRCDQTKREYNDPGDFSGIELLAAAASMDDDDDNVNKQEFVSEDSLMLKDSDASGSATQSIVDLKSNKSVKTSCNMTVPVMGNSAVASRSLSGSPEDGTMPKVNRQHWDLNTLTDAWDKPYDDSIAGNTSKDVDDIHMEERQKVCDDRVLSNPGSTKDESSNLKIEENKSTIVSPDRVCSEQPSLEERLVEPQNNSYSNVAEDTVKQASERDANERNVTQVNRDAHMETSNQVMITDAILDTSPFIKLSCNSGLLMSEEKVNTMSGTVAKVLNEVCSSNVKEFEITAASNRIQARTPDITAHYMPTSEISEYPILVQYKDNRDSPKLPGTFIQDGQPVLTADSVIQIDETFISGSTMTDFRGHLGLAAVVDKHEDKNLSTRTVTEDSSKSCSAGAQCDDPTATVGRIGLVIDGTPNSDVSQNNHVHVVDGDDLTGFQEGYDSPYEDGELRGSFLYSWDNECVDYKSDGRNGDGSEAADYLGSEIVEGGSEGSHGTGSSILLVKRFPEGKSKAELAKHSLRSFVKDDSNDNEIAGKGSNAGSGTTVEQSLEMLKDENEDDMKRSQLSDRRDTVDVKVTHIDAYALKTARGKLQSRIEGRSSLDVTDEKDVFFIQQCRSRHLGSYSWSERDISPDKYPGRHRPAAHGERDGVYQWTSWGSRARYTSNYQGAEGRSRPIDNYLSKGLHRPVIRRSPLERDGYFGASREMPLTRGVSNYRSRVHYSQRAGRDFGEDFEPLPDDASTSVRILRYLSRRDQSFSPSSGRNSCMTLPRRRSRSRSRPRSPRACLYPRKERIWGTKTNSRSPDFRSEVKLVRMPFSKPNFAADYGEGYKSPSRGRFSPQRNCRWVDDHSNFADNHMRRRKSPVRVFRRNQRFDAVGSSGRFKSDEYFRPMVRSGRFSFLANGDRRRDDSFKPLQRALDSDGGGNMRQYRHNTVDDFEMSELE
ncbi:hypothetical protein DH2020_009906 [Rehmannia glutinosa]|uniref:Uncharacterized protein n=1 Tax=Rehmannia glutinosa TaxID=99300 RepID=A0ABR0X8N2_REHGL